MISVIRRRVSGSMPLAVETSRSGRPSAAGDRESRGRSDAQGTATKMVSLNANASARSDDVLVDDGIG